MTKELFLVSGEKISSLMIEENSLKFLSKSCNSVEEFEESWNKKLSLATKTEIKFDNIKSIEKEDNDEDITIKQKGIGSDCEFSFKDSNNYDQFFDFFEKQLSYQKQNETLTPFKAIKGLIIGLVITIALTAFAYYIAIGLSEGEDIRTRKGRFFLNIIKMLGDKGVLLVGLSIIAYIIYQIWSRYKNPPNQIKLLPPNR